MAAFNNTATLSYRGGVATSNTTTGEIIQTLSAVKAPVGDVYTIDGDVTYVISLRNSGAAQLTGLTVTDDLGAYEQGGTARVPLDYVDGSVLYFVNGVLQATPAVEAGPPLVFTGINVPAGGNVQIVYEATVNGFAPPVQDGEIINTVTVTGDGITDVTATATVTAAQAPQLTITKALNPTVVAENGQVTYTFVIQNNGNAPASSEDNLTLTDDFTPALGDITVTYNGDEWQAANYTYDETTGLFTTVPGAITVPAATYTQDPATGVWTVIPGVTTITVTGTI